MVGLPLVNTPHPPSPSLVQSMTLLTIFQIQLDRILGKVQTHTPGPKRPSLTQQDLGKHT